MKQFLFFCLVLFSCSFCFSVDPGGHRDKYPELTERERSELNRDINQALEKAERRVAEVMEEMKKPNISFTIRADLELYTTMLQVKQTLAEKFSDSISMRDPAIRRDFIDLLNQEEISGTDLVEFQQKVNEAKRAIREEEAKKAKE